MRVGVLALQGAFAEHIRALNAAGAESFEIRQPKDLDGRFDGLVFSGGESTVQIKLLRELGLLEPLSGLIKNGLPVFGTCAGLILLAKQVDGGERCFGAMDIKAVRNAYGRQLGSFSTTASFDGIGEIPMTFIRAPYIAETYGKAVPLATVDGRTVAARQGNMLAVAFHPELTDDLRVHKYFLENYCSKPAR